MLEYIEVADVDTDYQWVEVESKDQLNDAPCLVHLMIQDGLDMAYTFIQRYQTKQSITFTFSDSVVSSLREFFQEIRLAQIIHSGGKELGELAVMVRTQTLSLTSSERSTLRKSRAARVRMLLDESVQLMHKHQYDQSLKRLSWVHLLDPKNEMAFELRIVCLRSAKRISECVGVLERWIEAYPNLIEPRLGLGEVWLYLDQDAKARACFSELLAMDGRNCMALLGLAQAKARLGEDYLADLSKAFLIDSAYTKEIAEHVFDFRSKKPERLEPMTLVQVAERYGIPIKRLLGRAQRGVLPFHRGSDLLHFSPTELDRYYQTLRKLGLEIRSQPIAIRSQEQLDLFEGES